VLIAAIVSAVVAGSSCKGSGGGATGSPPPTDVTLAQGVEYDQQTSEGQFGIASRIGIEPETPAYAPKFHHGP
jgi:hypothetical protein